MGYDASEMLGAPERAGVRVMPKGFVKRHAASQAGMGVGGVVGALVSSTASEVVKRREPGDADTPAFGTSRAWSAS